MKFNVPKEFKTSSGVYSISNHIDDRVYIGSTFNFYSRYHTHRANIRNGRHALSVQKIVDSYGIDEFEFNMIEGCERTMAKTREKEIIHDLISKGVEILNAMIPHGDCSTYEGFIPYQYKGYLIRNVNSLTIKKISANTFKRIIDEAESSGLPMSYVVKMSSQCCEKCKGEPVLFHYGPANDATSLTRCILHH